MYDKQMSALTALLNSDGLAEAVDYALTNLVANEYVEAVRSVTSQQPRVNVSKKVFIWR